MDAFEHVVAGIHDRQGYWTAISHKVPLTAKDKAEIGRISSPRWEIDVIAYKPTENVVKAIECKSYLDSPGVARRGFEGGKNLKLFNEPVLRHVVLSRLLQSLKESGAILPNASVQLCLAAGRMVTKHRPWVEEHFAKSGWELITPEDIRQRIVAMADGGYENSIEAVTAKMLLRNQKVL
ncbi:hypothetical protein [Botrimarina mediterranea]|uniref:NERD domain-containing protein n=1 Tax=Botrimarina mediterranea TaxID=2528022 RepID=A0A518KCW2_9BACT|nr:hypothetical protein [Botrimarina mediterranea]QDV75625.1 hypothetical protein Spa11_38450 [Botrimarina mediterranea]QDV80260.1 hypothetical protein K2D_38860 [Planctomycetes bacterium K2D]